MKHLEIWSDSACNNKLEKPIMGIGVHANYKGEEIHSDCFNAGVGTSNIGEWIGCVEALLYALSVHKENDKITLYLDSQLLVRQVNGEYQVKQEHLKPYKSKALELLNKFPIGKINEIIWIRREYNKRADVLSKEGLNKPVTRINWLPAEQ